MDRILIIGNSGAGKSTFAKKLAEKLQLPLVHLDKLFWHGTWEQMERAEFDKCLQEVLEQSQWIIDGNFNRTLPHRLTYCDAVFFFDIPTITCLLGVTKRTLVNYGKVRADMGGNCTERFDRQKPEFYRHILTFNRQHRKDYYRLLEQAGVHVVVFRSRRQADTYLKNIPQGERI